MKVLYFTATGNSLHVAKTIGGDLLSIPQMIKDDNYEFSDDKIGIVCPLYSWSIPTYVAEFLKKCKFNCDYLFAIVTYGIYSAGVTNHLQEIAKETDYNFDYINKVKMVDNYLPGFDMKKQIENEYKKEIPKQLEQIKNDIENSVKEIKGASLFNKKATHFMVKSASKPIIKTTATAKKKSVKVHKPNEGIENYYYIDENCIKCGICSKVCPVNNIEQKDGDITLKNHCIMCFSCLQNCPKKAIHLRGEVSSARYRNKNVSLEEIVKSNNQS